MRRRGLIAVLGSAGAAWPLASRAAQADRVRRIAVIMGFAEDDAVWQAYLASFRQRLQDFGWSEGRNIRFDYHFTGESTERIRAAASEIPHCGMPLTDPRQTGMLPRNLWLGRRCTSIN